MLQQRSWEHMKGTGTHRKCRAVRLLDDPLQGGVAAREEALQELHVAVGRWRGVCKRASAYGWSLMLCVAMRAWHMHWLCCA
jgi:hypothetical protein